MVDAGIQPSNQMFRDICTFAQKSGGSEYGAIIQEKVGKFIC